MKRVLLFLLLCGYYLQAQPLQNINYNYLYDPEMDFSFTLDILNSSEDSVSVVYQLSLTDTTAIISHYLITWEIFSSLSAKESQAIYPPHQYTSDKFHINGVFQLPKSSNIIAAKVINSEIKVAWFYPKPLDLSKYSDAYLTNSTKIIINGIALLGETFTIKRSVNSDRSFIYYYDENFPPATPAFAEAQTTVSAVLKPDSIVALNGSDFATFAEGLYLIQSDSLSTQGVSVMAKDDYPKYRKLENLVGPLTYITTKNEFDRLKNSIGDKKSFDKIIIGITGNTERAKIFMRNYYKRVEMANLFFSSYKEGWKTDRGMIYIIFGLPNAIYKFYDREVWEYENALAPKISFNFVRSSSIFDPNNFVLIRKKDYLNTWLEVVDLIRSSRF